MTSCFLSIVELGHKRWYKKVGIQVGSKKFTESDNAVFCFLLLPDTGK